MSERGSYQLASQKLLSIHGVALTSIIQLARAVVEAVDDTEAEDGENEGRDDGHVDEGGLGNKGSRTFLSGTFLGGLHDDNDWC